MLGGTGTRRPFGQSPPPLYFVSLSLSRVAMGIGSWIIFGLIAGALARFVLPGSDRGGCLATILIGVCGAIVGGWIGTQFGWGTVHQFDLRSLGIAVFGGVVLLFLRRLLLGR